jgi:multiple sugar transport system permease protein
MPRELDEAARLDGASPGRQFFSIMLPLAKPGLVALSILTILASWRDLLWPLVVSTDPHRQPLAVGLASLKGEYYTNYPVLTAGALLAMLPVIVLFAIMQRQFIQGIAFSGSKG